MKWKPNRRHQFIAGQDVQALPAPSSLERLILDTYTLWLLYTSACASTDMKTCTLYTQYILYMSQHTSTDMMTCAVQTHTHTTSHALLLALSDWQYSSPNPRRYHLQGHAVNFQCLPETRNEMGVNSKEQHSNNSVYSGQLSICQSRPWQHTSALRWQHRPCGAAEFPAWKLIRPSLRVVLCDRTPAASRLGQFFHLCLGKR